MGKDRSLPTLPRFAAHDSRFLSTTHDLRRIGSRAISLSSFVGGVIEDEIDADEQLEMGLAGMLPSFTDYPATKGGRRRLHVPLGYVSDGEIVPGKRTQRRVRRKSRGTVLSERAAVETPRSIPIAASKDKKKTWLQRRLSDLSSLMFDEPSSINDNDKVQTVSEQQTELKNARLKLFAARSALDEQPRIVENGLEQMEKVQPMNKKDNNSPGTYSLFTQAHLARDQLGRPRVLSGIEDDDADIHRLMFECRQNLALNENLLYNPKYDSKWKSRYTDVFLQEEGIRRNKPENRAGWVIPLKRICEKAGINPEFFTHKRLVELPEARAHVLHQRLTMTTPPSVWITTAHPNAARNDSLAQFLSLHLDCRAMQTRVALFNHRLHTDRDRVRVHGQYYNNIYLGKRMFGPSRKQKFVSTIMGGIERRFEIIDNQVNHLPYTHHGSDRNPSKCRNIRVKCRDSSRINLTWPAMDSEEESFIHANRITGGPLFNTFILTQAPMENTIGDFWRMVWQEKAVYIFMLISRKDPSRCEQYWPPKPTSPVLETYGLRIETVEVDDFADPLFRVTRLRIVGPKGEQRHVEHWQGDMNNVDNVQSPLNLLRLARCCSAPVIVHDHLGISRAACLVAAETAIASLIRGPTYKHVIQKAVHWVRSHRAFAVETPLQFVFIHRVVVHFFRAMIGQTKGFDQDYARWMEERAARMFIDENRDQLPGYRLLSPRVDPDLLRLARRKERPDERREAHDCVGELPLPMDGPDVLAAKKRLPNKYPVGARYT